MNLLSNSINPIKKLVQNREDNSLNHVNSIAENQITKVAINHIKVTNRDLINLDVANETFYA